MKEKISKIVALVAQYFGCKEEEILGLCRRSNLVQARCVLYGVLSAKAGMNGPQLAKLFNRTTHNSYYHIEKYRNLHSDKRFAPTLAQLEMEVDKIMEGDGR